MATTVYLNQPSLTINSVDLQDQCTAAEISYSLEELETTAFGDSARKYGGAAVTSLQNNSITVTLYQSFAASETEATIFGLVGIVTTLVLKPTSAAVSATNPSYTLTGAYLASSTPIAASLGTLGMQELTFHGGALVKATS